MSTSTVNISATQVRELRDKTGAPMMDCKNALVEAKGDMEQAVVVLRKRGMAVAAKKSARATSEGAVASYIHAGGKIGVLVEVNCETDFVARNDDFNGAEQDGVGMYQLTQRGGMRASADSMRMTVWASFAATSGASPSSWNIFCTCSTYCLRSSCDLVSSLV